MADAADDAIVARLDRLERQMEELQELRRELVALRAAAAQPPTVEAVEPAEPAVGSARTEAPAPAPPAASPAPAFSPASPLTRAWRSLERGDATHALDVAYEALRQARKSGDAAALAEIAAFAAAAFEVADGPRRERAVRLLGEVDETRRTVTGAAAAPQAAAAAPAAPVLPPRAPPPPAPPAGPPKPALGERAVAWIRAELTGARAFALVGGTVTLLGVIFIFILAANRGWFGPGARVALGAVVSLGLLGAGVALRARYGQVQAAFAAAGAGIAGAYTTLAAATVLYSYLPSWGALLVAAGIAAVGGWLAVAWSSQILAGLALVGAAAAPGLAALDDGITWPGPAFALVVLAATIAVAAPLRWLWLVGIVAAVAAAQLLWLAVAAPLDDVGAVAVTCVASIVLLAAAIAWQNYGEPWLEGPSATFALGGAAIALWSPLLLLSERRDAGLVLLGLALAFAVVALTVATRWRDLAWTIGAGALLLGGVAAANLLSGRSLTIVWAIEAATLAALAWRLGAPRFEAGALIYLAASAVHALAVEIEPAWPDDAFDVPRGAAAGLFVLAAASLATGLLLPAAWADKRSGLRDGLALGAATILALATAAVLSGRWLTLLWAVLAAALGAAAFVLGERMLIATHDWTLAAPRAEASALFYLAAGVVHAVAVEIGPTWPEDAFDVPRGAAAGLFVLAAASLATGLLLPAARADGPAAASEPTWDALLRARIELRAGLAVGAATILAAATAAVLSGRWLTILWAVLAAALGAAAFVLGERRLQPFALGSLVVATGHVLAVDAPPETLALDRPDDPLAPVASLVAIAGAAAVLAALARFEHRGIAWLGPLSGPERQLDLLRREQEQVRATLAFAAAAATAWAVGLVAIEISYEPGQVVASALWSLLGTAVVTLAARARSAPWQVVGGTIVVLALVKSVTFDWGELGDGAATVSLLVSASALLLAGFLCRWENPTETHAVEIVSLASGAVATVAAIVALERVLDVDSRGLGVATLAVVAATTAAGVPPYLGRRAGREEPWLRTLANGYWALALGALLFAESTVVLHGEAGTIALWGATAAALALAWKPLAEDRVWFAALGLTEVCALGSLALVTVPSRLADASEHPASGLWAYALVVVAAWTAALTAPHVVRPWTAWLLGSASALTLYGVSLGVLELAERISGASVETDFQRGHTVLSALWGVGALAVYVLGLARDRRDLRIVGLTLFALALAKLFLYDLRSLSSITRALSFLAVGAILMAAGFFSERIVRPGDKPPPGTPDSTPT